MPLGVCPGEAGDQAANKNHAGLSVRRLTHRLPFPDRRPTETGKTHHVSRLLSPRASPLTTPHRLRRGAHRAGRAHGAGRGSAGEARRSRAPSRSSPTGTATAGSTRSSRSRATARRSARFRRRPRLLASGRGHPARAQFARKKNKPDPGPTGGAQPSDDDPPVTSGGETTPDRSGATRATPASPARVARTTRPRVARRRRASTRPARRRCRSRSSCSELSPFSCSPQAVWAISAGARRPAGRRPARHGLAT